MKVHKQKAAKNYPQYGIKKGDIYYEWAFYHQKPTKSKTPPTRSQLTQNEATGMIYGVYDGPMPETAGDVSALADEVRNAAEVEQDKFDNMPEGLQQGDTGQRLEERANNFNEAADALDQIASELEDDEGLTFPPKPEQMPGETDTEYQARLDSILSEFDGCTYYEVDREAWTYKLNKDTLAEAISATEPET